LIHHHAWDFKAKSELIKDERWLPVFSLAEKLKQEYYKK
jgi:hypothetical protein